MLAISNTSIFIEIKIRKARYAFLYANHKLLIRGLKAKAKRGFQNIQNLIHLREGRMDNKIYDVDGGSESIDLSVEQFVADDGVERSPQTAIMPESKVIATPNPFSTDLKLHFTQKYDGNTVLKIMHQNGSLIFQKKYSLPKGPVILLLDQLDELPNGNYYYQLIQSDNIRSGKLLKLNQ
ncbi:MAG: hypothetical protein R2828_08100 [Saprospiraceae bacterium]